MNDDTFVPRGSTPADTAVLGVVVEIPQPWSQLLTQWRAKVGDNQAGVVPPHVTLLPPTEVPVTDRPAIAAHLTQVARCHPPFTMHLSGTGTFRPVSEVVFIAVARGIGASSSSDVSVSGAASRDPSSARELTAAQPWRGERRARRPRAVRLGSERSADRAREVAADAPCAADPDGVIVDLRRHRTRARGAALARHVRPARSARPGGGQHAAQQDFEGIRSVIPVPDVTCAPS